MSFFLNLIKKIFDIKNSQPTMFLKILRDHLLEIDVKEFYNYKDELLKSLEISLEEATRQRISRLLTESK